MSSSALTWADTTGLVGVVAARGTDFRGDGGITGGIYPLRNRSRSRAVGERDCVPAPGHIEQVESPPASLAPWPSTFATRRSSRGAWRAPPPGGTEPALPRRRPRHLGRF